MKCKRLIFGMVLFMCFFDVVYGFEPVRDDCVSDLIDYRRNMAISPWRNWVVEKVYFSDDTVRLFLFPLCDTTSKILLLTLIAEVPGGLSVRITESFGGVESSSWDPLQRKIYFRVRGSTINGKPLSTGDPRETDYEVFSIDLSSICGVSIPGIEYTPIPILSKRVQQPYPLKKLEARAYPNPFRPVVTIEYSVPDAGPVSICILDLEGRIVRVLQKREKAAGTYSVVWDGKDGRGVRLASGKYYYQVASNTHLTTRNLILLK
jgi:hypothetical protein